jgi:hypothetical protein
MHRRQRQASLDCNTQHTCLSRHSGWRRNRAGISIARARLRTTLTRRLQNRRRRPCQECRSFCILDAAVLANFCGWKRSRRVGANVAQAASAHVQRPPSNAPCSLIEVPVFVPGVGPPMFLLSWRNSTYEEDIQAARYFISKYPVFGLDSPPSKDNKRKMLYVLTMIELVRPLHNLQTRSHSYCFFAAQEFGAFFSRLLCLGKRNFQPSTSHLSPEKSIWGNVSPVRAVESAIEDRPQGFSRLGQQARRVLLVLPQVLFFQRL